MAVFKIRAYATDYYEKEIEAATLEEAKEIFQTQWENGEIESEQTDFNFQDEEYSEDEEFEDGSEEDEFEEDDLETEEYEEKIYLDEDSSLEEIE